MVKYLLTYGFRRFSCCKKLGWKKIPCYLKNNNSILELPIEDVVIQKENTRLKENSEEMIQLMESIKQHGLLEPIGVSLEEDLSEDDFLILNLIENLQRTNPTPFEQAQGIMRLKGLGLNNSEISVRMSIPKTRVENLIGLTRQMPEYIKEASFIETGQHSHKNGRLSFSVLSAISTFRASDADRSKLVEEAKKNELSKDDIFTILGLVNNGMDLDEAIIKRKMYKRCVITVTVNVENFEKTKNDIKKIGPFVNNILQGKIQLDKNLFYYKKRDRK